MLCCVFSVTYLSTFKFRVPLIFAPFNFRPLNFRHPLLKLSLPLIFATLSKFEFVSISINLSEIEQQAKYLFVIVDWHVPVNEDTLR